MHIPLVRFVLRVMKLTCMESTVWYTEFCRKAGYIEGMNKYTEGMDKYIEGMGKYIEGMVTSTEQIYSQGRDEAVEWINLRCPGHIGENVYIE